MRVRARERRRSIHAATAAVLAVLALAATAGCDQLNRPMSNTGGSSSSTSSGSPAASEEDGGSGDVDASAPAFRLQPGDVQL